MSWAILLPDIPVLPTFILSRFSLLIPKFFAISSTVTSFTAVIVPSLAPALQTSPMFLNPALVLLKAVSVPLGPKKLAAALSILNNPVASPTLFKAVLPNSVTAVVILLNPALAAVPNLCAPANTFPNPLARTPDLAPSVVAQDPIFAKKALPTPGSINIIAI